MRPVDFREGHNSLAAVMEYELGPDPHSGVVVVFRAKRADRVKILLCGTGLGNLPLACNGHQFRVTVPYEVSAPPQNSFRA